MNRRQKKKALAKALTGTPLTWRELKYLRGYAAQTIRTNLTGFIGERPKIKADVLIVGGIPAVDSIRCARGPIPWEHGREVVLLDRENGKLKAIPVRSDFKVLIEGKPLFRNQNDD
jgi:hypothetical protein